MNTINLYRYARADGGVTTSPLKPPEGSEYVMCYRLIADEGKLLTDGVVAVNCTDTDNPSLWSEVIADASDPEPTAEERIAALEDELAAAKILLGLEE